MIDPEKMQLLARFMEQYHNLLQSAQEATPDPKMRQELQELQSFLRDTHAQAQDEAKKFNSTVEAETAELKQTQDKAEKEIAEAAALRQKKLEELAARQIKLREIDPLLDKKIHSALLNDFGNRDWQQPRAATEKLRGFKEVWQDWPTVAAPPQETASPAEETLPDGARPFARLIDPQQGEELRQILLAEFQQGPSQSRPSESPREVWQDWPEG
ncbi:MAG TPA: hypothetical protein VN688_18325 [Gemmataceae bacterium]|nr:hypothetical protein [Gemmataceae bacterium]